MKSIEIDGVRFVKASEAAALVGYTTDYIGQLTRGGKIEGKRIGRTWFVRESDVLEHKKGNRRSNKEKTREALHEAIEGSRDNHIYNKAYNPDFVPEFRKRLLGEQIKYETDTTPLTPESRETVKETPVSVRVMPQESAEHIVEIEREESLKVSTDSSAHNTLIFEKVEPKMEGEISITDLDAPTEIKVVPEPIIPKMVAVPEIHFTDRLIEKGVPSELVRASEIPVITRKQKAGAFSATLLAVAVVAACLVAGGSVLSEKILVYEHGKERAERPLFVSSYNLAAVSSVMEELYRP